VLARCGAEFGWRPYYDDARCWTRIFEVAS
jgi:hypothetical protein